MNSPRTVATAADSAVRKLSPIVSVVLVVIFGVADGISVQAQNSEQGKEIARGLLRALIECQLGRPDRHSLTPGRPFPAGHVPGPQPALATPEMLQLRRQLASVAQESGILSTQLSSDSQGNAGVRSRVPNALSFQATATVSQQHADLQNNHLVIQLPVQSLDQNWRPLAHRLSTTQGLSTKSRESAERINRLNTQLCQILGIGEQFNSRELVRAADLLTADLGTLTEEVSYQGSTIGSRNRLLSRMRKLQEQGSLFANLAASGAQFQNAVTDYQSFYQGWQALRPEVDQLSARGVTRTVSRIQETHRTIHQLLRLDFGLDQELVRKMVDRLERAIIDLYRTITLDQMLALPDSRSLSGSADSLFGTAQDRKAMRNKCDEVTTVWQQLRPKLSQCQTEEQETVEQTIDSLIPALIRLRTMLED